MPTGTMPLDRISGTALMASWRLLNGMKRISLLPGSEVSLSSIRVITARVPSEPMIIWVRS